MSVRKDLAAKLAADWATIPGLAAVRVVATERKIDPPQRASVALIRQNTIDRMHEAPTSHRTVGVLLTIISKYADLDKAADDLDTLVDAALDYLGTTFRHGTATAVGWGDPAVRLAYDIPLTITASKE